MMPSPVSPVRPRPPMAPNINPMPATPGSLPGVAPVASPGYANVSTINPNEDLRDKQIAPGATPDRLQFAKEHYDQFASDLAPQVETQRRSLLKNGAALGRLGSGMLRTSFGDLASELNRQDANTRAGLFTNAAEASVGDQANNRAELRGERGYQNALEQNAFDRSRTERMDQEDLLNSSFGRAMSRAQFGYGGNPAGFVNGVAGDVQGQANSSAQGFAQAMANRGAKTPTPATPQTFGELPQMSPNYGLPGVTPATPTYRPKAAPMPRL